MPGVFRVNTNVNAFRTQRSLFRTSQAASQALERLSSGLRINRASDDPAGLSAVEVIRSRVVGGGQATKNVALAIAMLQTADSGYQQIGESLLRLKELYVASANDSLNSDNRTSLATEALAVLNEAERIAESTAFNDQSLINSTAGLSFQFFVSGSSGTSATIDVTIKGVNFNGTNTFSVGATDFTITPSTANDFASASAADTIISEIEDAIKAIAAQRTNVGSSLNRLQRAQLNVQAELNNDLNASSIIRDANFAAETANLTRAQILVEAGTALLGQATQLPRNVGVLISR